QAATTTGALEAPRQQHGQRQQQGGREQPPARRRWPPGRRDRKVDVAQDQAVAHQRDPVPAAGSQASLGALQDSGNARTPRACSSATAVSSGPANAACQRARWADEARSSSTRRLPDAAAAPVAASKASSACGGSSSSGSVISSTTT